jgi:hypothetical protein
VEILPNGKGDIKHLNSYQELLLNLHNIKISIACIVDNNYELIEKVDVKKNSSPLLLVLKRKEIENYLLEPKLIHSAIKRALEKKKKYKGLVIVSPEITEIQEELNNLLSRDEIKIMFLTN